MKIKATVNGTEKSYEVGELSLGEFRTLKRMFGLERMDLLDPRDPDHLVGYLVLAELRTNPGRDMGQVVAEFESVSKIEVEADDDDEVDPTQEGSQQSPSEPEPTGTGAEQPGGSS